MSKDNQNSDNKPCTIKIIFLDTNGQTIGSFNTSASAQEVIDAVGELAQEHSTP